MHDDRALPTPMGFGRQDTIGDSAMNPARRTMLWLNLLGGVAVLGSYYFGLSANPTTRGEVWGNVPLGIRPLYTANMFLAAAGYLTFTYLLLFETEPETQRSEVGFGYGRWNWLYAGVLIPSALWLPLTFAMIDAPSLGLWIAIRVTLAIVGLSSLGFVIGLVKLRRNSRRPLHTFALVGACFFSLQTALLDALIWTAYFPA